MTYQMGAVESKGGKAIQAIALAIADQVLS
jgi:hypothetical protein